VIGAGASYGDHLERLEHGPIRPRAPVNPPLADGFFRQEFLSRLGYEFPALWNLFPEGLNYISENLVLRKDTPDDWESIDLEKIFTSLELDREFWGVESNYGAHCTLAQNQLLTLITKLLAVGTKGVYGTYARVLASRLSPDDSVVTFNWDLLLDQELYHPDPANDSGQYQSFIVAALEGNAGMRIDYPSAPRGLYLKMHGSINWFQCINRKCPASDGIVFWDNTQFCLLHLMGAHTLGERCTRCGSATKPLIVPPLLRKPIAENWIFRSIWGLAHAKLRAADVVVIIGFSVPPTDFSAYWLLHSTVGLRDIPVFVVNPANDDSAFRAKMCEIFSQGPNFNFREISQVAAVVEAAKKSEENVMAKRSQQMLGTDG
jgi:hypothetical protein